MEKEIIITFESEDTKIQDCVVYSDSVPPNKNIITQDELMESGLKKMMKLEFTKQFIPEKIGVKYQVRITAEYLKELFNF